MTVALAGLRGCPYWAVGKGPYLKWVDFLLGGTPMLEVRYDGWLREFGAPNREQLEAGSLAELLETVEQRHPRLRFKLRDETGQLRRYVRVFVDGSDVSGSTGVTTSLAGARTIDILHSIAGG